MARPRVRRGYLRAESEAAFQQALMNLAVALGWSLIYHPPDNRPSRNTGRVQDVAPGYPDLTMVRGPRLIFSELKAQKGVVSAAQKEWLAALEVVAAGVAEAVGIAQGAAGAYLDKGKTTPDAPSVEVYVWRPDDWPEIEKILR